MSIAVATPFAPFGSIAVLRAVNSVENAVMAMVHWNTMRRTRFQLSSLSDDVLRDIGLTRGSLEQI
jgi:uncharacterized protein YjiS (DUF1127 family)